MFASQAYLLRLNVSIPVSSHLRIWWDEIFDHRLNVCIPGLPDEHSELVSLQWRWCHLPCGAQGEPEIRPCLKGKQQTVKRESGEHFEDKNIVTYHFPRHQLGFIAQSCLAPGFTTLMANLFAMRSITKLPSTDRSLNKYHIEDILYTIYFIRVSQIVLITEHDYARLYPRNCWYNPKELCRWGPQPIV